MPRGLAYGVSALATAVFLSGTAGPAAAWDGFDAETSLLVEVEPERVPAVGDTVSVRKYKGDTTRTCLVEEVRRNLRTVELIVRCPDSKALRTLVMDRL